MPSPTFTAINGEIKTPLRFYRDYRLTTREQPLCEDDAKSGCPFHLLSKLYALPPFQFPKATSDATVTFWGTFNLEGTQILDLTSDISKIDKLSFDQVDYFVYSEELLAQALPNEIQWSEVHLSDGSVFTSELFKPGCFQQADELFNFSLTEPMVGWETGTIHDADFTWNVAGDPVIPGPFNGMVVINTADGLIYTYSGGSYTTEDPEESDYRFISDTGEFIQYCGGFWSAMQACQDPPWTNTQSGMCFDPNNIEAVGAQLPEAFVASGSVFVTVTVSGMTTGSVKIIIGGQFAQIGQNGTFTYELTPADGSVQIVPLGLFDGCVSNLRGVALNDECQMVLAWSNCGNVGTMFYDGAYTNRLYLPQGVYPTKPTPVVNVEASENGQRDPIEGFFRKDVQWTLDFGEVPWYLADALSEIPAHDNVTLSQRFGLGTDTFTHCSVNVQWGEGPQCMARVTMTFQVEDVSVLSRCCEMFPPPCQDIEDFETPPQIDGVEYVNGDWTQGLIFTATIPSDYSGLLQYTNDGGTTWLNTDLDLLGSEWSDNEIPIEAPLDGFTFRILVYFEDCVAGPTDVFTLECFNPLVDVQAIPDCESDPPTFQVQYTIHEAPGFELGEVTWDIDGGSPTTVNGVELGVPFTVGPANAGVQFGQPSQCINLHIENALRPECPVERACDTWTCPA